MPAKSKAQQRFMGMVHAVKKGELDPSKVSRKVRKAAGSMKSKDAHDFASTKHKGKPEKVKQETKVRSLIRKMVREIMAEDFGGAIPKHKQENRRYLHDLISLRKDVPPEERINAYSHMRSLFFNTSETIPVEEGWLMLGKWQDIHFLELDPGDNVYPQQTRKIICTFIEE